VLRLLLAQLPTKTAVRLAAENTGAPRNRLYDAALAIKQAAEEDGDAE
jgi:16S rRNA (cytidine1402-2'-O)-methyltransferase